MNNSYIVNNTPYYQYQINSHLSISYSYYLKANTNEKQSTFYTFFFTSVLETCINIDITHFEI